ncbi:MAG: hypothetical protein FWF51_05185 [Chitinivibrionia bacterium]|nr:hypothetical protein [Chitinivibrionia bacterium]
MILFFGYASQRHQYISEGGLVNSTENTASSTDKNSNNDKRRKILSKYH